MQLCKLKSRTVAQTQIETMPDITVQVWLVQLLQHWTEAGKDHKYICIQMPVLKYYICKKS